jgi:hypothetical protein
MLSALVGFMFAFGLLNFMNMLFGAKIGKGMPAFWFCCLTSLISFLMF